MKLNSCIFLVIILLAILNSCSNIDDYYLHYSDIDCNQVPLIKPVILKTCDRELNDWILNTVYEDFSCTLDKIYIIDSIIVGEHFNNKSFYSKNKSLFFSKETGSVCQFENEYMTRNSVNFVKYRPSQDTLFFIFIPNLKLNFNLS